MSSYGSTGWGGVSKRLTQEQMDEIVVQAAASLSKTLPFGALRDRQRLAGLASQAIRSSVRALSAPDPNQAQFNQMVTGLVSNWGAWGFWMR